MLKSWKGRTGGVFEFRLLLGFSALDRTGFRQRDRRSNQCERGCGGRDEKSPGRLVFQQEINMCPIWRITFSPAGQQSEEHTSELQSHLNLVCRLLLEKKKTKPLILCANGCNCHRNKWLRDSRCR